MNNRNTQKMMRRFFDDEENLYICINEGKAGGAKACKYLRSKEHYRANNGG